MSNVQHILEAHPHWPAVNAIYHTLHSHGYKAFLAGGCVRDALLGIPAHDLDVATDATPDQIEKIFGKTVSVGKSFGVMRVIVEDGDIEVATFRNDGEYKDGRRPDHVEFSSPEEDAQRRDFTVNALFYDLAAKKVLDFVEGEKDLYRKLIKTVGEAERRFREDHLRLLRAARFVAQLDFVVDPETLKAIGDMAALVKTVSGERVRDEMGKLLKSKAVQKGLDVMVSSGLMQHLFPFRLQDNSWDGSYGANEVWQLLSLFVRRASQNELRDMIQLLRLSVKEQRSIQKAWELWQDPHAFTKKTWGQQIQLLIEPGVYFALQVLLKESHSLKDHVEKLFADWNQWQNQLPKPFLTGEDLQGQLTGREIGVCLAEAFEMQLERKVTNREEALRWLQKYLQKGSHG